MLQICYASRAAAPLDRGAYRDLAGHARRLNARDSITGLLLYDGARFVQAIEGPEQLTRACMARIERDPRHRGVSIMGQMPVSQRQFGNFAMAAMMPEDDDATPFVERIKTLVADVSSPQLKAVFIGFAMLSRAGGRG